MTVERRNVEYNDQFPVGMRVLAVDDDPICLKLLESLLRRCKYHVTTRDRAIDALGLLRENKDQFDLVISDVHMPDMDGFKLLELVGLEMDLPVIMLSANGDTKLVMKGITHGACDYLLKPVRLEELKNIWQHVIRRKSSEKKTPGNSDNRENRPGQAVLGQGGLKMSNSDRDPRAGKRRKDLVEENDDDNDSDENGQNNDDPASQKKARVVWSVELHRKFVAAVNQLGFERAVPKKILELMNVDKLTRENVASHLQKYRLYLKRLSSVANQQANMVAALGGADSSFMHMNSMTFHHLNSSGQFQRLPLPPSGVLGRLNSSASLGLNGLSPSGISPLSPTRMSRNPIVDSSKFQSSLLLEDQTDNVLHGMPASLEFDHILQHKRDIIGVGGDLPSSSDTPGIFPTGYLDANKNTIGGSIVDPLSSLPNRSLLLQGHSRENQERFGNNQSSVMGVPFDSRSSFSLPDQTRCDSTWENGIQSSGFQSNPFPPNISYSPASVQAVDSRNNGSSSSTGLSGVVGLDDSRFHTQSQTTLAGNNLEQSMGYSLNQNLHNNNKLDMSHFAGLVNSTMNSLVAAGPPAHTPDSRSSIINGSSGYGLIGQLNLDPSSTQFTLPEISGMELNRGRFMGSFPVNGAGSLEDVVNPRWGPTGATMKMSSNLGGDVYPMRTCI